MARENRSEFTASVAMAQAPRYKREAYREPKLIVTTLRDYAVAAILGLVMAIPLFFW
jgi:hypothetical protein